jgi:hypothetical protein
VARARWYDPSTGGFFPGPGGVRGGGVFVFETPGANGSGANDWVLVVESDGKHP